MSIAPPITRVRQKTPLELVIESWGLFQFNADQYQRLIELGIVPEDSTYELLRGVILKRDKGSDGEDHLGHNPPHALVVTLLSLLIGKINNSMRHVRMQLPIILSDNDMPEPDASIVRGQPRDYAGRLPGADDVLCVFEVSESSLGRDKTAKLSTYASAGIAQYILINLRTQIIEEYTTPNRAAAVFDSRVEHARGSSFQLNLGEGESLEVPVNDLLP